MNKFSIKGKLGRQGFFTALTVAIIVLGVVLNVLFAYLGQSKMIFADLTPEGLYTLTDKMKDECAFVDEMDDGDECVKILFCNDTDYLLDSMVTRLPYFTASALANEFDNIEIETVNVKLRPTAVAEYKTTSLSSIKPTDVIVSYGGSYRIVSAESFWTTDSDGSYWSYNGEYKIATLIKSLTAVERPSAYFVTNHGETYYDVDNPESEGSIKCAAFYDLLVARGLAVKTLDLSREEEIPEDCVLLIINNPRSDFTYDEDKLTDLYHYTETDKIDKYLVRREGAIMVAKDYAIELPTLEQFMHEWGIDFSNSLVKDEITTGGAISTTNNDGKSGTDLIGVYDTDKESYGYAIYGDFASLASAPRFIVSNTGYIKCSYDEATQIFESGSSYTYRDYAPFFKTSENAKAYAKDGEGEYGTVLEANKGVKDIAAVIARSYTDSHTSETTHSYVFAVNSPDFFSNETVGNASYANYDVLSSLITNMSRIDTYASIDLGGISLNSSSYGGKRLADTKLYEINTEVYSPDASEVVKVNSGISTAEIVIFSVIAFILPIVALAVGIVIRIKRKFL